MSTGISSSRLTAAFVAVLTITVYVPASVPIASSGLAQDPMPTATDADPECAVLGVDDKCERWTKPAQIESWPDLVVSPDSERVFTEEPAAYDAQTGELLWAVEGHGRYDSWDLAISPNGDALMLAGDDSTKAFDGTTGELLWAHEDPPGRPQGISVGPDSERVYVTGNKGTAAYDMATGALAWFVDADATSGDESFGGGHSIHVSPHGDSVYVSIESGHDSEPDRAAALDAATGEIEWIAGVPNEANPQLYSATLTPDGSALVLTGGAITTDGYVAAFDTETGDVRWDAGVQELVGETEVIPWSSETSPDSETIYLAISPRPGFSDPVTTEDGFVVALDATTGDIDWVHRKPGNHFFGGVQESSLAVGPDGDHVYTLSVSHYLLTWRERSDLVTMALDADNGETVWQAVWNEDATHTSIRHWPGGLVASPDGSHVYAAHSGGQAVVSDIGESFLGESEHYGDIIAYETGVPGLSLPGPSSGGLR